MASHIMKLLREGGTFIAAGLAQLAVDWLVFVALTAAGAGVAPANIAGRVSGMLLGFWLNGRFTFASGGEQRLGWRRFLRFIPIWLLLTALSTLLVALVATQLGLGRAWLAKPLVEAGLAALSFVLMRTLVFR